MILQNPTSDFVRPAGGAHRVVQLVELGVAPEDEPFLPSDVDDHFVNLRGGRKEESIRISINKAAVDCRGKDFLLGCAP